jgi:hypothetical protein
VGLLNGGIRDLLSWEAALFQGRLLKPSTLAEMSAPFKLSDGTEGIFGLSFASVPMIMIGTNPDALAADIATLYEPSVVAAATH